MPQGPIRVLMICKACVVGAYQRKLEAIAAHPDIDLTVVVPPAWGDQKLARAFTEGYRLIVEPIRFNGNFHLHTYPHIARRIAECEPQVVHVDEEPYNLATYHAMRAARRAGAKTLFFSWQNLKRRYPPPFGLMERWVLGHADYALVGSQEAAAICRDKGFRGPLSVIPQFGVDPEMFAPPAPPEAHRRFTIGYAGRLVPEKGLDLLIEAAARLPGEWYLRLLGAGPEREALHTRAGLLNIGGSVSIEKPVPSTQMPGFYHELDALVLPSRTQRNWKEQFGRVLIEAMACGVPVVGARSGAIPEVIGEAGLLFPEGDADALRDQLHRLMADRALHQSLAAAGRKRVLAHFTQEQIAAQTVAVYRELADQ
jgi:glycosyltransferase involved in cell wall biosynthesis